MRIAFVSQPRDAVVASGVQRGSVAIVTWELARRLAARHDVVIYAPLAPGQAPEEHSASGVTIRRVSRSYRRAHRAVDLGTAMLGMQPPYFARAVYFREYVAGVAEWLRRCPADVVHIQVASQFISVLRRAAPHATLVLHAHDELLTRIDKSLIEPRLALLGAVVTCSDYVTQRWRARFPAHAARIWTAGNGADLERFQPQAPAGAAEYGRVQRGAGREILYVGRVSPEKGVHVLASAFERVARSIPDARLTIVGPSGLLPFSHIGLLADDVHVASLQEFYGFGLVDRFKRQILRARRGYVDDVLSRLSLNARSRTQIVGALAQDALPEIYRRASVLVAPSMLNEPFGLPLAEALASGLPIIASRAGGMAGVVEDGVTGRLVERGDVAGLASVIRTLLMDASTLGAMRLAARAAAEARFGWKHAVARLEEVYASALVMGTNSMVSPGSMSCVTRPGGTKPRAA